MKTADLIVQYLYSNKHLTLQDIGSFTLADGVNVFSENEKDISLPPDAIQFTYDQRAPLDEGLIKYIMEFTGKIRPLAASDLESYIMLNKQFLNIGKPLIIDGVGTLLKTQTGEYAFTQAGSSHVKHEEAPKVIKEKLKEDVSFSTLQKEKSSGGGRKGLWLLILLLLAGGAFAAWYFMFREKEPAKENTPPAVIDTLPSPKKDTVPGQKPDSTSAVAVKPATADTNSFYIVIKEFHDPDKAQKSVDRLTRYGNKVMLYKADSSTFRVRMPFMKPLSDTLNIKDSISKFFNTKARVELP